MSSRLSFKNAVSNCLNAARMPLPPSVVSDSGYRIYAQDIAKYPLLNAKQETELFQQLEQTTDNCKHEILNSIVESNLRLVIVIAMEKCFRNKMDFFDLVQEGNLGLIGACKKYDWRRDVRFATYAKYEIFQSIKRAIIDTGYDVRIPTHIVEQDFPYLNSEVKNFFESHDRLPKVDELATVTGWNEERIRNLLFMPHQCVSLESSITPQDLEYGEQDNMTLQDVLADKKKNQEESLTDKLVLKFLLSSLTPKEATIINMRHLRESTDIEIAKHIGMHRNIIPKLERKIMEKLMRTADIVTSMEGEQFFAYQNVLNLKVH